MIATDGVMIGAKPAPRTYGTYPRILGELVRDARVLGLEEAVRKMTGASAARLGLADRGIVADGLKADLVVFDPARVRALATYDEPRRYPEGIPVRARERGARGRRRRAHGRDARSGPAAGARRLIRTAPAPGRRTTGAACP